MCYKKETMGLSRKQYFQISFPVLLLSYFCFCLVSDASANDLACSFVKYAYSAKGFDDNDVPRKAILGDHLRICEQGMTCCTEEMEYKLSNHSQAEFARLLKESVTRLKNVFHSKTQQFDKFFQELLDKSQKDFHDMFSRTYGVLYEQNSFIFESMFDELRKYYLSGGVDLTEALDGFFSRLYLKMFQVLNGQYTFDDYYLKCVEDQMDNLKPFGDVPRKLTTEIKRSFVATRTFVQALSVGRDVVRDVLEVRPSQECSRALMKMSYCPHCHGLPDLKPCGNYCLNVMKGCLAYHADLNSEWNSYIDALLMLAHRLETSFNIEAVIDPIEIRVSDAIMNFQENGHIVSPKLFESCGKPRLQKRDVTGEIEFHTYNFGAQLAAFQPTKSGLERLVDDVKKKLKRTKNFWSQLASELCNNPEVAGDRNVRENSDSCWNGLAKARYDATPVGNGVSSQKDNPEVSLDITSQNVIISQQILTLHLINSKLNDAYNGLDVVWQDSDSEWDGSGSGSGSGDGWIITEENQHNFGDIYFSSSTPVTTKPHEHTTPPSSASQILNPFVVLITALLIYVSVTWW
ncbi:glypican-6-like isoform X1 [Tachypleus tridentatus]|uniref:glypican-6-like isoform X1 n=1 Tax=Tachypleus tridentatus TaxID=6853 RepID=UPI003FD5065D